MEIIKNYLESMFRNLPNTPEVQRAKHELGQMMEDKYTELKNEGKTENEAVGIVISEFGNLDELANDLGITSFMKQGDPVMRRNVSMDEVKQFLKDKIKEAQMVALGVMLCILSPTGAIFMSALEDSGRVNGNVSDAVGAAFLFVFIAAAVGLFIYSGTKMSSWNFLRQQPCSIDFATAEFVHRQKESSKASYALFVTVGVILCILSVVPAAIIGCFDYKYGFLDDISGAFLFVFVAIGVFMLILAGMRDGGYDTILKLNASGTMGANFVPSQNDDVYYNNKVVEAIMSVYWPSVTCVYLCWSFLSFDWHTTWIIWPVAAIISGLMKSLFGEK